MPVVLTGGTVSYIYGPDGIPLEQMNTSGELLWYHHDQQGSTRLLTNNAGAVVGTASYNAYGQTTATTGTTTALGYDGQYTDPETGLIYLRARYYDPTTGQFITRDPLRTLTEEPYNYGGDNPVNGTDPSGTLCTIPIINVDPCAAAVRTVSTAIANSSVGKADIVAAKASKMTVGVCGGAYLSEEIQYGGEVCFAASPDGTTAITIATMHGVSVPGVGINAVGLLSNAPTVKDLGGPFHYAEGSFGKAETSVGGSYSWGKLPCGEQINVWTGGWAPSLTAARIGSLGYGKSNTAVFGSY